MLFVYIGTDREKARGKMNAAAQKAADEVSARLVRITDANMPEDMKDALRGGGMFGEVHVVIFENTLQNYEMHDVILAALPHMGGSPEQFFIFEEKLLAEDKRIMQKYAKTFEQFDAPKKKEDKSSFALAYALRRSDKKTLWIGLERQFANGAEPEKIHGLLFWAAKQMVLSARAGTGEYNKGAAFAAALAELPHEARRKSVPLEYALLRFALSVA